ncbi:MAG TPA: class I SAM-dependent methyltransferase [Solirubrobacteraceae bacterium]|nr:class I SAM-dependent methyltransferase [Solirubrobacteraceae bacterium]
MATTEQTVDDARLEALIGQVVVDCGGTANAALVLIGDELGLYRALAQHGPLTPDQLAVRTNTNERYVREWLGAQAASGYVGYDPSSERFAMSPEQVMAFADETSPVFVPGAFEVAVGFVRAGEHVRERFVSGDGYGWHEQDEIVHRGTERFFRSGYQAHLVGDWIPALDGVDERLRAGGRVADVGCGYGASAILIAQAYPDADVVGFDYHEPSIAEARRRAAAAGLGDRVRFQTAAADSFPGSDYDLVACFDSLHDMGDPVAAARHVRNALAADGTWLLVEPRAGDRVEDNLNPVGRLYYAGSTLACTPNALSQDGRVALGAQAGEARLREVATDAGFSRFRRATETPFNLVLEARP